MLPENTSTGTEAMVSNLGLPARSQLGLRVYRNLEELGGLRTAWDELLRAYPLSSTFSTWEWLSCWWRSFGQGREMLALALLDADSRLVGLAPFSISKERFAGGVPLRVLRLLGDGSADSDNLDLPARPGFEQVLADCLSRSAFK